MVDLAEPKTNFDIPLIGNITVTVKPITTASMIAAQTAASKRVRDILDPYEQCKAAGLVPDSLDFDMDDPSVIEGLRVKFLIEELAVRHIVAWSGVTYNGQPAPLDARMIADLMGENPIGQIFYHEFTIRQVERFAAKKDGGVGATGISAAAPIIAKDAQIQIPPVPVVKPMKTGVSAPMTKTSSGV